MSNAELESLIFLKCTNDIQLLDYSSWAIILNIVTVRTVVKN